MNLNITKLPINDYLSEYRLVSILIDICLLPLFYFVRILNRLRANKKGNVVVILLHKLGDTVFTIPAVKEIQKHFNEKISIVCFPESIPIYNLALDNINICEIQHEDFFFGHRIANRRARQTAGSLSPYIVFDLTGTMISASLIFNLKAKQIVGINGIHFRTIYDHFIAFRENPHLMDLYLDAISPLIQIQNRDEVKGHSVILNPNGKILVHPFAGWKAKEWNFKKYYRLMKDLSKEYKIALVAPINNISMDTIDELIMQGIEIVLPQSVENLIEHIKSCSIFIGNDSGPIYIATLLGKPTISLYGPTNPEYSRPIGDNHHIIFQKIKCTPEKNKQYCLTMAGMFGCPAFECMNLLEYDDVYSQIKGIINNILKLKINDK
jgi:ADP-heptose:LPS heptosyltransferase